MPGLLALLLTAGQLPVVRSVEFPAGVQATALTATVRIGNVARMSEGSGVILGREGTSVYILTAAHLVDKAQDQDLVITTFSADSYPNPDSAYRSGKVVAVAPGIRDLALVRILTSDRMPGSLSLCPPRDVPDGENIRALAVGCTDGEAPTALVDTIRGKRLVRRGAEGGTAYCWEVLGKHKGGRSGGPLVDRRGHLLGALSGTTRDRSYFCHTGEIRTFLRRSGYEWLARGDAR
jgi:S1-C subfamily serine protease